MEDKHYYLEHHHEETSPTKVYFVKHEHPTVHTIRKEKHEHHDVERPKIVYEHEHIHEKKSKIIVEHQHY